MKNIKDYDLDELKEEFLNETQRIKSVSFSSAKINYENTEPFIFVLINSKNFKKQGFFIPNIRIGRDTEHQLSVTINRTTLIGAFSLTVIACLPYILSHFASVTDTTALGGTGIIVAVGVAMEMLKHMDTVQKENRYEKVHLF